MVGAGGKVLIVLILVGVAATRHRTFALGFHLLQYFLKELRWVFVAAGLLDAGRDQGELLRLEFRFHLGFGGQKTLVLKHTNDKSTKLAPKIHKAALEITKILRKRKKRDVHRLP